MTLDPQLHRALAERIRYYGKLGIYDFYRREDSAPSAIPASSEPSKSIPDQRELDDLQRSKAAFAAPVEETAFEAPSPKPESRVTDPVRPCV